jgi:hypothetical protein
MVHFTGLALISRRLLPLKHQASLYDPKAEDLLFDLVSTLRPRKARR